ncbi:hypothetical protein [Cellulosimicrobium funkei]|uniref:hypothetical protein n=1 Tax=Cellulosimicrobium funkei TaxID=264251 RepID=UPI00343F458B
MADESITHHVGARLIVVLASLLALVVGAAAAAALVLGRAVDAALPTDVGAFRGVVDAQDVADAVEELDGVDSVTVERISGDTLVPVLGLVIVRTQESWNRSDAERLAGSLEGHAARFDPSRPVHIAFATPEAFIAVSGDAEENAARIDAADRALAAGASEVHVAPENFDVAEWSPQEPSGQLIVTVVPRPEADPRELQGALGPEVQVATHVRWIGDSDTASGW